MKTTENMLQNEHEHRWHKRLAGMAFAFFLIKGLLWLTLPVVTSLLLF